MKKHDGLYLAGWGGFIHFAAHQPQADRGPNKRDTEPEADSYGEDDLFPGRVNAYAILQQPSLLGATPCEMREEWQRRRIAR